MMASAIVDCICILQCSSDCREDQVSKATEWLTRKLKECDGI